MGPDKLPEAITALVDLVARLRGPGGCPWDAKQTDATIKIYLLEEAYEVLEAVERFSPEEICAELGDLLFQILFLARLAEERGDYDFTDVVETITAKMIRRHPHVFGQAKVASAEDVALNWAKIKAAEKGAPSSVASTLKGVPYPLPALLRAHRLGERASKVGFDWSSPQEVQEKVQEEWGELQEALDADAPERVQEELGDLLFSIVQWVRHLGFNAEHLLRLTNQKFITRFEKMEKEVQSLGLKLEDVSLERMDEAWEKAKA